MRGKSSSLEESDIDPTLSEETWSTTASSVTPDLEESLNTRQRVQPTIPTASKHRTLIIFDYDDTILPTSFLSKHGFKLDSTKPVGDVKAALDEYSLLVNLTLKEAKKRGHVIIVTNAEAGWIQLTAEKFLPLSCETIHEFQHLSARSIFEPRGVLTPIAWKESAFRLVVEEYLDAMGASRKSSRLINADLVAYQVISLGDSAHEREAVLKVCEEFKIISKSLKFMERPDLDALSKQHQLIHECLDDIVKSRDNLDLCIQTSPNGR